ncbi:50S ribosomal protein L32 [Patescibacteria group bacterium]|nr:50S ribosomal protein L32 [Patescibacteria group bacterium]
MSVRMRHTSSHTKNRRSHHALAGTTIVTDKESSKLRLPHRIDESTGMYRGIQIVSTRELRKEEKKETKKEARKREHIHADGSKEPVHGEKHLAKEESDKKSQGLLGRMVTGRAKARSGMGGGTGS